MKQPFRRDDESSDPLAPARAARGVDRKQFLAATGAGSLALLLAACGDSTNTSGSGSGTTAAAGGTTTAASSGSAGDLVAKPVATSSRAVGDMQFRFMTQIDGVPYYQTVARGAKAAAADLGIGSLEVTGPPRVDSSLQVGTVQTWITQRVDVIAVSSTDPDAMSPVIDQAIAAGITVISWDVDAPKSKRPVYVNGWNDDEGPRVLFDKFVEDLGGTGRGEYAFILPSLTSVTHRQWCDTMQAYQKQKWPDMKLVASEGCDADQTIGNQKAKQLKSKYPDLVGIVSVDAGGTVGIAQATEELNLVGRFANTGLSTPSQMRPFLMSGTTRHTVLWDPAVTGYLTTVIALRLAQGREVTDGETLAVSSAEDRRIPLVRVNGALQAIQGPPLVFTRENVADFDF